MRKHKRFLLLNTLAWCLIGAICWFIIGDRLIEQDYYALCFIWYPGVFFGIIGGCFYLFGHDKWK